MDPHAAQSEGPPRLDDRQGARRNRNGLDAAWVEREAMKYAARWETTRAGLKAFLERKIEQRNGSEAVTTTDGRALISEVLDRLSTLGYVDDRRFAEQLCTRARRQGRSRRYIRSRLEQRGVPDDIVHELTARSDPESEQRAAWRFARKRRLGPFTPRGVSRASERQRQLGILARQGYSEDLVLQIIDSTSATPHERD